MSWQEFGANGAIRQTITLDALSQTRPEFKDAPNLWQSELAPKLKALESTRRTSLQRAIVKSGLAFLGTIVIATGLLGLSFQAVLFTSLASIILIAGLDWARLFTVKVQYKNLILRTCCAKFGFAYDSLHPDIQPTANWKDLFGFFRAYSSKFGQRNAFQKFASTGRNLLSTDAYGPLCPTPAYDSLCNAGLLPTHHIRNFEDLIIGKRANASFSLIEATLETSGKYGKTVFQGLLFHIEYPQDFLGKTVIARSGFWNRLKVESALKKVKLASIELEKAFSVYSNDQVEARTLLTPDRMERLIALERHFKAGQLCGVFEAGHMTIALQAPDQFEAGSIFSPLVQPERYIHTLQELGLVCDAIDGFLTRDWVKDKL